MIPWTNCFKTRLEDIVEYIPFGEDPEKFMLIGDYLYERATPESDYFLFDTGYVHREPNEEGESKERRRDRLASYV